MKIGDIWYRYADEVSDNCTMGEFELVLHKYIIRRETQKCIFIVPKFNYDLFSYSSTYERKIGKDWKKKFAHPTKEEAFESYRARKQKQVRILENQLRRAKIAEQLTPENKYGGDCYQLLSFRV